MKIEVNIEKHHLLFAAAFFVVAGIFFVTAYDSNPGNPSALGHTANEIGPGSRSSTFGGSSTFFGGSSANYYFPGKLGIGPNSLDTDSAGQRNLFVNDPSPFAGIGLSSNGAESAGNTYIDFIRNGFIRANIDYHNNILSINEHAEAASTTLQIDGAGVNVLTPVTLSAEDDAIKLLRLNPGDWSSRIGFFDTANNRLFIVGVDPNGNLAIWNRTTEQVVIESATGKISVASLRGNGASDFVCVDSAGRLFRSLVAC